MGIEYEWKFQADEQAQAAILAAIDGQQAQFAMQTTYYDTPSGQLSGRHYTLRRRMENEVSVCTLKAPAPGVGRGEWEVTCNRIEDSIDMLCKLGAPGDLPLLVQEGLIAVCGARFHRITRTIILEDCELELAIDKGILAGGGKERPLCEVEVELKSGAQSVCDRYAKELAVRFGLTPEPKSKFRRALALYKGE